MHHLITGAVLVLKGSDKISHHPVIGSLVLLFGVLILGFFVYNLLQKRHSQHLELMVRWFEALVSLFIAYIFFTEGRTLIQYVSRKLLFLPVTTDQHIVPRNQNQMLANRCI